MGKEIKTLYKAMEGTPESPLSTFGEISWKVGKWYKIKGRLKICGNGFHASTRLSDALAYVRNATVLALVEVRGKSAIQRDKECWSEMRIVKTMKRVPPLTGSTQSKAKAIIKKYKGAHKELFEQALELAETNDQEELKSVTLDRLWAIENAITTMDVWERCALVRMCLRTNTESRVVGNEEDNIRTFLDLCGDADYKENLEELEEGLKEKTC
jgi:hypothetical protein